MELSEYNTICLFLFLGGSSPGRDHRRQGFSASEARTLRTNTCPGWRHEDLRQPRIQFKVGYYLFALLFLIFDIKPFPVPVLANFRACMNGQMPPLSAGLVSRTSRYSSSFWLPASLAPGRKEFSNGVTNYLPKVPRPVPGGKYAVNMVDYVVNWARANSWALTYGTSCCAIEMMSRAPWHATISHASEAKCSAIPAPGGPVHPRRHNHGRMAPAVQMLWEQIPGPSTRYRHGRLHHLRRPLLLQQLCGRARRVRNSPGGCIRPRLSARP